MITIACRSRRFLLGVSENNWRWSASGEGGELQRNSSGFGTNQYRGSLVKFCIFIFYLIVIPQISKFKFQSIQYVEYSGWEQWLLPICLWPFKWVVNKYETENHPSFSSNFRIYHKPSLLALYSIHWKFRQKPVFNLLLIKQAQTMVTEGEALLGRAEKSSEP